KEAETANPQEIGCSFALSISASMPQPVRFIVVITHRDSSHAPSLGSSPAAGTMGWLINAWNLYQK
ncbi:hypothetical protein ACTXO4_16865, partial [Glutamicibacter arilaitensis]